MDSNCVSGMMIAGYNCCDKETVVYDDDDGDDVDDCLNSNLSYL